MFKSDGTKLATIRSLCDELANRININLSLKLVFDFDLNETFISLLLRMKAVEVRVISVVKSDLRELLLSGLYFGKIPFQTIEIYCILDAIG